MSFWRRSDCSSTPPDNALNQGIDTANSALSALANMGGGAISGGTAINWPAYAPTATTMTSTGPWFSGSTLSTSNIGQSMIPNSDSLSLLPDGRVLVTFPFGKVAITHEQLKDIQALLALGALDKLVGATEDDGQ